MERLQKKGTVQWKTSGEVCTSKLGIGFEKLDRNVFDPEKAYEYVGKLGVKWVRIQSGWQRTEKAKGVYDFAWLDAIVDRMLAMGIQPWMCLCYGNELYSESAKQYFGAVGVPPIHTEEERSAWSRYVHATVSHFKGRVHYYEVWNEPDNLFCWKHGINAEETSRFTAATAQACKAADPSCEVIGLTLCEVDEFADEFVKYGGLEYVDGISYHAYCVDEELWSSRPHHLRELCKQEGKSHLKLFQGESGTQSDSSGCGALSGRAWTPEKQMKFLLRHLITDLGNCVDLVSYFTCVDMIEALNGRVGDVASYLDYGYFGVLGADFDENGRSVGTYTPKPSYYALQTLCSVLSEEYEVIETPVTAEIRKSIRVDGDDYDFAQTKHYSFARGDGSVLVCYWVAKNILTETYEGTVSVKIPDGLKGKDVHLIDLKDGTVYELDKEMISEDQLLLNIPVLDRPLALMFGNFCDWRKQ